MEIQLMRKILLLGLFLGLILLFPSSVLAATATKSYQSESSITTIVGNPNTGVQPPTGSNSCLNGWPTSGALTQGPRSSAFVDGKQIGHLRRLPNEAVDIGNNDGTPIVATFDGTIASVCQGYCGGFGNNVVIRTSQGTAQYAHLLSVSSNIKTSDQVDAGIQIGRMGSTGEAYGPHLHYELSGFSLAKPNIPENITPPECPTGRESCSPSRVNVCESSSDSSNTVSGSDYWFLLNRSGKYEILFKGVPEKISQSQVIKKSRINPGAAGRDPTPIPQKLGRRYWTLKHYYSYDTTESPAEYEKFGPYFIALDIPYSGQTHARCNGDCYGPVPYAECGPSGNEQCDWGTAGEFAIHGNNRLDGEGSAGCVRHSNSDIEEIFNKLSAENEQSSSSNNISGTRYYIVDSNISEDSWTDENLAGALR